MEKEDAGRRAPKVHKPPPTEGGSGVKDLRRLAATNAEGLWVRHPHLSHAEALSRLDSGRCFQCNGSVEDRRTHARNGSKVVCVHPPAQPR